MIILHDHSRQRIIERGTNESEVQNAVLHGETFPAKHGRTGFRRNFVFNSEWRARFIQPSKSKFAVQDNEDWVVVTVLVKYF